MTNPEIKFVTNKDIDRAKWDQCIANSPFGIVYAYSWYLDRICQKWDALIWGDYLYIMPLVNNRKYGLSYIYQPFFTQQLGIFSNFPTEPAFVDLFLNSIPKQFRLTDMNLNIGNVLKTSDFGFRQNTTYHLNLQSDISAIRNGYNSNTRRNIQKAIQNKISIAPVIDIERFLEFTKDNLHEKSPEVKTKHYQSLKEVIRYALDHQLGESYGAWDSGNNLVASVFFVTSNQKYIYLAASSNQTGIEKSAMFLLIDTFIQNTSEKKLILDFEGSNIPGIARFYAGIGAKPKTYYKVHQNHLQKLQRIFKKKLIQFIKTDYPGLSGFSKSNSITFKKFFVVYCTAFF